MPKKLLFLLFIFVCSCATYYESEESQFYAYLKNDYSNYADYKKQNYDWKMAKIFYKKAKKIEKGLVVLPEKVSKNMDEKDLFVKKTKTERKNLRDKMYLVLNNTNSKMSYPEEVANMQFYYDCWLLEEDLYRRYGQISRCKQGFVDSLAYLEFKLMRLTINERTLITKEIEPEQEEKPFIKPKKYIIYFGFDSSAVDEEASKVILGLIRDAKATEECYKINIVGHADRVGNLRYNKNLSKRRTETIKHYLIRNGISKDFINESWSGEIDPGVITSNESKEEINRRVVITIDKTINKTKQEK